MRLTVVNPEQGARGPTPARSRHEFIALAKILAPRKDLEIPRQSGAGSLGEAEIAARTEKQAAILTLLASDPLVSHAEIARRVGVSRERVRQIALKVGETGNQRRKRRPKKQPVYKWPGLKDGGRWLIAKVNQWLGPAEFYCAWCHRPRPIERKAAGSAYCKECACLRLCAYLKTPAGKAYKARYEKTEQRCAYLRRWRSAARGRGRKRRSAKAEGFVAATESRLKTDAQTN